MVKIYFTLAFVLVALASLKPVLSLDCYSCYNVNASCNSLSKTTCTESTANATVAHLKDYFVGVPTVKTSNFDCLRMNYTKSGGREIAMELRGCVYREINSCYLVVNNTVAGTWTKAGCQTCSGNYCNPAGTYSSSVITLASSALVVLLAKLFVY